MSQLRKAERTKAPLRPCATPGCPHPSRYNYIKWCTRCENQRRRHNHHAAWEHLRHLLVVAYALGMIKSWPYKRKYDMRIPADRQARGGAVSARISHKVKTMLRLREGGLIG